MVDGQQLMQEARVIKTQDEITLLNTACMMVDAAYDELYRFMKPGVRENECVGLVSKVLYDLGSEHVEGVNAISGERCSPHPHVFSDRALRPGDPAYFDILHSYNGYRTCYYRTFAVGSASQAQVDAYKRCRDYLDAAINAIKPGVTTADVVKLWPKAEEFGFPDEEACLRAAIRSRRRPLDLGEADLQPPGLARHPEVIEEGHGLRAGNVLARLRWLDGGAYRGAAGGDKRWLRGHDALPGRGAAGGWRRTTTPSTVHSRRRARRSRT